MEQLSGFSFFPVEFDKAGKPVKTQQIDALKNDLSSGATTDLIVISHGWNNDIADARNLYEDFFRTARQLLDGGHVPAAAARRIAVLGVLWPSKKFTDKDLIPGGAAGLAGVDTAALRASLKELHGVFDAPDADRTLAGMEALLPRLEDSDRACGEFVTLARSLVTAEAADDADGSSLFFSLPPQEVFEKLKQPVSFTETAAPGTGGATPLGMAAGPLDAEGGAAGLGAVFSGIGSAAGNVLNFTTYYQMKERAGLVGRVGVNPLLRSLQAAHPALRLHLVGHSFGGRLVTAAVAGENDAGLLKTDSLSLLQAAYSHYGLAEKWDGRQDGIFRRVLSGNALRGPGVITHTVNDKAVGIAYPLASLLAGQVAAGLGDENDRYGGMGRNGAQKTPEAQKATLKEVGADYGFKSGKLYNLLSDAYVKSHGDITGPQVVYAVFQAIG
jgi:hypothetical protein